jgi:hypothetical protein
MYIYMHVYICIYIYVYMYLCIYTDIYMRFRCARVVFDRVSHCPDPFSDCAFSLKGSGASPEELAQNQGISSRLLWEWYSKGTRLVTLCSAGESIWNLPAFSHAYASSSGSFYFLLLLASLGMTQSVMDRRLCTPNIVVSFANNLRSPSGKWSLCPFTVMLSDAWLLCFR